MQLAKISLEHSSIRSMESFFSCPVAPSISANQGVSMGAGEGTLVPGATVRLLVRIKIVMANRMQTDASQKNGL